MNVSNVSLREFCVRVRACVDVAYAFGSIVILRSPIHLSKWI